METCCPTTSPRETRGRAATTAAPLRPTDLGMTRFNLSTLKLLTNLRKTAIKYRVNFTVRKYGGSIRPKDFAFMAADIVQKGVTQWNIN